MKMTIKQTPAERDAQIVKDKMLALFDALLAHDGFGRLSVEMKILKRNQKEIILDCGKQYRFVIDMPPSDKEA